MLPFSALVENRKHQLDHTLTAQGLRGGEINPDPGQAIWFTGNGRAAPGNEGISVIAGHVARGEEPDVFAKLTSVGVNDKIVVTDRRGTTTTYVVTRAYTASKELLREDPAVWGTLSKGKRLALVTCDDAMGRRPDGHRLANYVVIATA